MIIIIHQNNRPCCSVILEVVLHITIGGRTLQQPGVTQSAVLSDIALN
jgi:hypothetical protein